MGKGYCKYESLLDGTLTLYDIGLMNNNIDCEIHNNNVSEQIALERRK